MPSNKSIFQYVDSIRSQLEVVYLDATVCTQYAWWLLMHVTHKSHAELIAYSECMLDTQQIEWLEDAMHLLIVERMPIAYVLGSVPFAGLTLRVEPPILIPRPETEEWVLALIAIMEPLRNTQLAILDICSGSGCIALALAHALPHAKIVGLDSDEHAIALSRENARLNAIKNVTFIHSDLYQEIPDSERYDLIVSNPPYIGPQEVSALDQSVLQWEAYHALIAEDNGLAIIKRIIDGAPDVMRSNNSLKQHNIPNLFIEIGYTQAAYVAQYMKHANLVDVKIHHDLAGKDRVVSGSVVDVAAARKRA